MTPKHLCTLLLVLVAVCGAAAQSEDIIVENDNQFPPENQSDPDFIDGGGSGDGTVEQPLSADMSTTPVPLIEDVQPTEFNEEATTSAKDQTCPKPCVCHYDGYSNFVVGCSGYELTEFPSPLDPKTTILNLHNNKLTELPKELSSLKNLKVLNAENNEIMALALGSVSDLPELTVLKLANNRLVEYPKDLQNSLQLTKLEELDLGNNDMRTALKSEFFSNFPALRKLTLAVSSPELVQDLCETLKSPLETVCTESCNKNKFDCLDTPEKIEDGFVDAVLPAKIPFEGDESNGPTIHSDNINNFNNDFGTEDTLAAGREISTNTEPSEEPSNINGSLVLNAGRANIVAETPTNEITKSETDVQVGATTDIKTGGVDKSVIGIIVAAMVVVVAGIAIKKNWSSIKKRFSSSPRPVERAGANGNGITPEEVPLQDKDKSPV